MELNSWKQFAEIAGIGGVAIGFALIVFKEIVRKSVFPMLTKEAGYRLLRLITICVWSIACFGIGGWVWLQSGETTTAPNSPVVKNVTGDVDVKIGN